jgi:hypothetical protein
MDALPNTDLNIDSIDAFNVSEKKLNDTKNKIRENIIGAIINQKIPPKFYTDYPPWDQMKKNIDEYLNTLCKLDDDTHVECVHKGGRNFKYDFDIIINKKEFHVEFKFNAECVNDCPQFSSPCKPSNYLDINFEEWFYDNYLSQIAEYGKLEMPPREIYIKKINNNKVECVATFKQKYDTDKEFNAFCKKIDKKAIKEYQGVAKIDTKKLSEYLLESQKDKHYMLYKDGKFYHEKQDENLFKLKENVVVVAPNYICNTLIGYKLEVKLRFKNGCGIQFPAFQIKRKIPTIKELRKLCDIHSIQFKKQQCKKDIQNLLDEKNIIY